MGVDPQGEAESTGQYAPRPAMWNQQVLQTLRGADAFTIHKYVDSGLGGELASDPGAIADALSAPGAAHGSMAPIVAALPELPIWVTEFNEVLNQEMAGRWLHGLFISLQTMGLLELPHVDMACMHSVITPPAFGALFSSSDEFAGIPGAPTPTTPAALTAAGHALSLIAPVLRHAHGARPIVFTPNPTVDGNVGSHPALYGWRFDGRRDAAIVVNGSDTAFALALGEHHAARATQLSGDPLVRVAADSDLTRSRGTVRRAIAIPAYSVMRVVFHDERD